MTGDIATALESAIGYLKDHRDEARYTDSPASARLDKGLLCNVTGPDGACVQTDMPTGVGGGNAAPSPAWFMRAALAACDASLIAMRAAQEGIELDSLEVTVDSESDDYGILGIDSAVPAGPLSVRVRVSLSAKNATQEQLHSIAEWGHDHCPVADATRRAIPLSLEVSAV
jgi:uncharacterized OsmC-like protein